MLLSIKAQLLAFSPAFLRASWDRIEASPVGYRLAKGAFWSLLGAVISRGLALVSSVVVGRMLSAHGFGELGMLQSTVGVFGTVAGFGLGMSATKHVAEFRRSDPNRAGRIIALGSASAWLTSGIMAAVLALAAPWLATHALAAPHLASSLRVAALLLLLTGVNGAQTGALSGFEAFKAISKISFFSGLVAFPLMIAGVWLAGIMGALWALIVSAAVTCVLTWLAVRREAEKCSIPLSYNGCSAELSVLLHFNIPAMLNSVMLSFSSWACASLLVNQMDGYAGMGVYNAAKRVQQVPELLLGMMMAPFIPVLSDAFGKKDTRAYASTLLFGFALAALLMVPLSLVQLAAPWLTILPYGKTYMGGENVVRWMMLGSVAYGILWPLGAVIVAAGRMWMAFWLIVVNTALLLGFGWFLVPKYGATGYAAAWTIAFVISNIPCVYFLYSQFGNIMRGFRWGWMLSVAILLSFVCWVFGTESVRLFSLLLGMAAALFFMAWRLWFNPLQHEDAGRPHR